MKIMVTALSSKIQDIMLEEMKDLGPFIIKKQCKNVGVDPERISKRDLPKVAYALSETMASFGADKAKKVYDRINELHDLEEIVDEAAGSPEKLEGLFDLGESVRFTGDYTKSKQYFEKLLQESKANRDKVFEAKAQIYLGLLYNDMNKPKKAGVHLNEGLALAKQLQDDTLLAIAYRGIGYSSWRLGEYSRSLILYESAIKSAKKAGLKELVGVLKIDTGLLRETQGNYRQSLEDFSEAISILKKTDNLYQLARAYNNSGEVYKYLGKLNKAIENYELCRDYAKKAGNDRMMGYGLGNMAECYAKQGVVGKARANADKTLKIFEGMKDDYMVSGVHLTYGIIYCKEKNRKKMDESFGKALDMLRELNFPFEIATNNYEYAKALKEIGDKRGAELMYKEALRGFKKLGTQEFVKKIEVEIEALGK